MYSTLDGAKSCAKQLKRVFDDSGFYYPLHKCQTAIAKAGGYRDWHDLSAALDSGTPRPVDAVAYRRRLFAALPVACRSPLQAWLDGEEDPEENLTDPDYVRHWYRDGWPFERAMMSLHRRDTALIQRGSGKGQQLRDRLVMGPLLNLYGGPRRHPLVDPETCDLIFHEEFPGLFGEDRDHPDFEEQFARLVEAGVYSVSNGRLTLHPPQGADVIAELHDDHAGMAEHWAQTPGNVRELARSWRDALALIGVPRARQVAEAITAQGSAAYTTDSGAILTLLSDLADHGEPEAMAQAYLLFAKVHPRNAPFVREAIPAKVVSRLLGGAMKVNASALTAWTEKNPDWASDLKAALSTPLTFSRQVSKMAESITALAA